MRGRKHPLEIFRQSGSSFVTQDGSVPTSSLDGAAGQARPALTQRPVRGAYLERVREMKPPPAPAPPPRRSWVAKQPSTPPPPKSTAAKAGALPLWGLGAGLAALVLLVGGAYAFKLWYAGPKGTPGSGNPQLSHWRDPLEDGPLPSDGRSAADSIVQERDGTAAAAGSAGVEFWVLAASGKLTTKEASEKQTTKERCDLWQARFSQDKKRLAKALKDEFLGMTIQLSTADNAKEAMLRIGPAATEDDPILKRVEATVRGLGGGFEGALIKKYKKP